ncbi:hypothetical protein HYV89_00880 [Candidatus Woesearchaeota archaeon]|nr:hypothetical protein [Candidatus Woesearchaeota archaeon]
MSELKTIKIRVEIHSKLMKLGKKGESFSDIIDRLIEGYKEDEGN